MKSKYLLIIIGLMGWGSSLYSQEKWSLEKCIAYALDHNFTVEQNLLTLESKKIQLSSAKMGIVPNLAVSVGQNFDFGRAPGVDGIIINESQSTTTFGAGISLPIFEGFKNYNQIQSGKLDVQAALHDLEEVRENIELNVTAYYLQVLLNKEILEIARQQAVITEAHVQRTEELVKNGKVSNAELYTAKATHAGNIQQITEAANNLRLALLDLTQLLNLTYSEDFDIETIDDKDFENLLVRPITLSDVINRAMQNRPAVKAALVRIDKSIRDIKVARSGWYPSLSLSANYGTGYYHTLTQTNLYPNLPFSHQFKNNSREMIALSLNIPVFDRLNTYHNVSMSKLQKQSEEIKLEETKVNLIKNIEQAYANAMGSRENYAAAMATEEASRIAYEYEEIKYNAGSSTVFEFNESKNKYEKAQSDVVQAKYNFLIRIKILEFYSKEY